MMVIGALCIAALLLLAVKGPYRIKKEKILPVRILLLPHFELGEVSGGFPGEAQLFYEKYLKGSEEYPLKDGRILYYNPENRVAMCITGICKVNCAETLTCILADGRVDCSKAYIFAFGCAGGASGYSTLGDVCIATGVCDYELGHTADIRELTVASNTRLWYHDSIFDDFSFKKMNPELVKKVYTLVKDTKLKTTEASRKVMAENFGKKEWVLRDPEVILGVYVSSDNYWKGEYHHLKALDVVSHYFPDDTYAITEMEDIAIAEVADKFGMLDRCIFMRVNVNPDVFLSGITPESLWGQEFNFITAVKETNMETIDIFETAMENNFAVGSRIIDAVIAGWE